MSRDFLEVGEKGALICDDGENAGALQTTIEAMGFRCHRANTPEEALEKIAYTTYDLISVAEELGGETVETNPVLLHLSRLPMSQRRHSYSVLIGSSFRTLDAMQAFANSVHLVVSDSDVGNIGPILKRGLADYDRMYSTYLNALREAGELAYDRRRK